MQTGLFCVLLVCPVALTVSDQSWVWVGLLCYLCAAPLLWGQACTLLALLLFRAVQFFLLLAMFLSLHRKLYLHALLLKFSSQCRATLWCPNPKDLLAPPFLILGQPCTHSSECALLPYVVLLLFYKDFGIALSVSIKNTTGRCFCIVLNLWINLGRNFILIIWILLHIYLLTWNKQKIR